MKSKLTDYKAKLLKLDEKGRQWEADILLLKNSEVELKTRLAMKENELEGRSTETTVQSIGMAREINTSSLSKAMSQICLNDAELIKLKQ